MNEFEWTYDIIADPLHVGAEFRIDCNSDFNSRVSDVWPEDRFIHFKLTHVGFGKKWDSCGVPVVELLVLDSNDSKEVPGNTRQIKQEDVLKLVKEGYWQQL
jgi:hypothetical protein